MVKIYVYIAPQVFTELTCLIGPSFSIILALNDYLTWYVRNFVSAVDVSMLYPPTILSNSNMPFCKWSALIIAWSSTFHNIIQ
jgi:hypothetical protein